MEWCFCSQTGHSYLLMPLISKIAKYMILIHNYLRLDHYTDAHLLIIHPNLSSLKLSIYTSLCIFSFPAPLSFFPIAIAWVKPCRWFLSSYSALLVVCSFMPQSFDPLSGLSPHRCFVLRGVKGCCYLRLAGLASAVLGWRAEWDRSYQHSEPLPSVNTSVSSSLAPHANYTLIARLEHSPIRMGPFWN